MTLGFTTLYDRELHGQEGTSKFDEKTEGYTLADLSVKQDFGAIGQFTLGVENVFDKQYILSWSQVDFFKNYWAGRGRFVSLTWSKTF
jgi:iron complex outermembrane receptor protein